MLAALLFSLLSIGIPHVFADTPQNTITVTPSIAQIDLAKDKPTIELFYKNTTDKVIRVTMSGSDFTDLDEGWKVKFLDQKDAKQYSYSLSSWMQFDTPEFILKPGEQTKVTVQIKQDQLAPGGHYGSVLARLEAEGPNGVLSVQGMLSSLVFVRTNTGKEMESLTITSLLPVRRFFEFPDSLVLRIRNDGNVQTTPYGLVQITDPFHRLVAKGILNEGSLLTLPETERHYEIKLEHVSPALFPGVYKTALMFHYGKTARVTKTVTYFVLGSLTIPVIFLIVVAGISFHIQKRFKKKS